MGRVGWVGVKVKVCLGGLLGSLLSLGFSHYKLIRNEQGMRIKINKNEKEYGEGGVCQCHGVSVLGIRVWVGLRAREKVGCTSSSPFFSFR